MPNRKRVALVTGGSRGIGLGIARCLAREGWDLTICGRRPEESVQDALRTLRDDGAEVLYCPADVSQRADRERLVQAVREHFGRLNALVNNAGMAPRRRDDILVATEESFEELIRVNLQGPYFLTQTIANWLIEQKQASPDFAGFIVNISSTSATVASTSRGDYCITKAGISMATKLWAVRLAELDLPVYEVQPGIIQTDMTAKVQQKYDTLIGQGLLLQSRWGQPEDVGKAVAMLLRGDLPYSTGQVVVVDGGLTMGRL